jgi:hypothetical protein
MPPCHCLCATASVPGNPLQGRAGREPAAVSHGLNRYSGDQLSRGTAGSPQTRRARMRPGDCQDARIVRPGAVLVLHRTEGGTDRPPATGWAVARGPSLCLVVRGDQPTQGTLEHCSVKTQGAGSWNDLTTAGTAPSSSTRRRERFCRRAPITLPFFLYTHRTCGRVPTPYRINLPVQESIYAPAQDG